MAAEAKLVPDSAVRTPCSKCAGNSEVVTDWDRYMHPQAGDAGDEAVADCEECDGTGYIEGGCLNG